MNEFDDDRAELERARKARLDAASESEKADKTLDDLHRTSVGIRVVVDKNGYLTRFREMIRGA